MLGLHLSAQTKPHLDDQACGVFTRAGVSVLASVQGSQVTLVLGESPEAFVLTLPAATQVANRTSGNNICVLVLNASEDEVAIGVPLAPEADSATTAVAVARFNLTKQTWQPPVSITPPPPLASLLHGVYRNSMRLVGYRSNSANLLLASSDQRLTELTPDGHQSSAPANLEQSLLETPSSISLKQGRFWTSCNQQPTILGKATPCSLFATSLFGSRVTGPKVLSPLLHPQPNVAPWAKPEFYADLGQTLVFASYESDSLHSAYALWIANLTDASIHQLAVPARFNDTALTGQFAVSTDGTIMAFTIGRSRLECCLVDNYVPLGDRIVVVDLVAQKLYAEIRPINRKSALALAVQHTQGKTTLLVDWGSGWQTEELPEP